MLKQRFLFLGTLRINQRSLENMRYIVQIVFIVLFLKTSIFGQCGEPTCGEASLLCNLRELDGLTCQSEQLKDGYICLPSGGGMENVRWWSFVANGKDQFITITPNNCSSSVNLHAYIYSKCSCTPEKIVDISNQAVTLHFWHECGSKVYLAIDGEGNTNCAYTMSTSIDSDLNAIGQLSNINRDDDNTIEICAGNCKNSFKVYPTNANCINGFIWTLDGIVVSSEYNKTLLNFTQEGTFELCVFAYASQGNHGEICGVIGPTCSTIKVNNTYSGKAIRKICRENTPFRWGKININENGTYNQSFTFECCTIDSIVEFEIIEPDIPETYYISCEGIPYVDPITNIVYPECFARKKIILPPHSEGYCDNSYYLSVSYPKIKPSWIINNKNGQYEINPNLQKSGFCDAQISQENYSWYLKSDLQQKELSKEAKLIVSKMDNYCLNYSAIVKAGSENAYCLHTFCEPFTQVPTAEFKTDTTIICPGTNLKFTDQSSADVWFWNWQFVGGEPSSSTLKNPTIYYDKPGTYEVILTVENQYFKGSITKSNYIKVLNNVLCGPKNKRKQKIHINGGVTSEELDSREYNMEYLDLVPNPSNGKFRIIGIPILNESIQITIADLSGRIMYSDNIVDLYRLNFKDLNLDLSEGIYILSLILKEDVYCRKLVIQK